MQKKAPWFLVVLVLLALTLARPSRAQGGAGDIHPLANGWNISSVSSGANVFTSNLVPTHNAAVLRLCIVLGSSLPIQVLETDGTTTFKTYVNGGSAIPAGTYWTGVIELRNGSAAVGGVGTGPTSINFVVTGGATTVPILRATEVFGNAD